MLKPVKRPNTRFWVARGAINGKQVERSTGTEKLREAKKACKRIEDEIRAVAATPLPKGKVTVAEGIAAYRLANPDARFLDKIEAHAGDTTLISEVNNAWMRDAAAELYPEAAGSTIRRQLYTPMKAVINFLADDELCAPARLRSPKDGAKRIAFFTPEQADELLQQLAMAQNQYIPALFTGLFGQGSRFGETMALDGTDVNLDLKYAILRDTKNGEERVLTLTSRTVAAWSRLPTIGVAGPLFRRFDGHPFESRAGKIRVTFAHAVEKIGLDPEKYTPHVCRHSWATWFYDQTKDILRLKSEGGWKSEEYQRYTKTSIPGIGKQALKLGWDFKGESKGSDSADAAISTG